MDSRTLNSILVGVYQSAATVCERREAKGGHIGNGHHLAQEIEARVRTILEERLQRLVAVSIEDLKKLTRAAELCPHEAGLYSGPEIREAVWHAKTALADAGAPLADLPKEADRIGG